MGRGVPPGPPRVRASMKPRTTALLRAVPNSSSVYLVAGREGAHNAHVLADDAGSLPKGKRLRGCFDSLAAAVFCQRLNKKRFRNKIAQTTVDYMLSLNILAGWHAALDIANAETGENICESCGKFSFELNVFWLNFIEKMCECHEKYARYATFPIKIKKTKINV